MGDSVTDWANLAEYVEVPGGKVLNRGISGDTCAGLLRRVQAGFVHGADACIVLIGVNDLIAGASPNQVAARVAELCTLLRDTYRVGHVVLEGWVLYPPKLEHELATLSRELERYAAANKSVSFLDLNAHLLASDEPASTLFVDSAGHLMHRGIELRVQAEIEHLRRHVSTLDVRLPIAKTD